MMSFNWKSLVRRVFRRSHGYEPGSTKSFNWAELLRHHPVFSSLSEEEIKKVLTAEASQERRDPPGSVILREGEPGNSVFLIGSGLVQVTVQREAAKATPLALVKEGEFFGEMAVIARQPRSATVIAKEPCTLLEIDGQEFLKLLEAHPDLRAKIALTMSERMKQ